MSLRNKDQERTQQTRNRESPTTKPLKTRLRWSSSSFLLNSKTTYEGCKTTTQVIKLRSFDVSPTKGQSTTVSRDIKLRTKLKSLGLSRMRTSRKSEVIDRKKTLLRGIHLLFREIWSRRSLLWRMMSQESWTQWWTKGMARSQLRLISSSL